MFVRKIVSGAQTGADQGALEAALGLGVPIGGYAPWDVKTEIGKIPDKYLQHMTILPKPNGYRERTIKNIEESDLTFVFLPLPKAGKFQPGPGTWLTIRQAQKRKKLMTVGIPEDVSVNGMRESARRVYRELSRLLSMFGGSPRYLTLNVGGPRESSFPGIGRMVESWMKQFLQLAC